MLRTGRKVDVLDVVEESLVKAIQIDKEDVAALRSIASWA